MHAIPETLVYATNQLSRHLGVLYPPRDDGCLVSSVNSNNDAYSPCNPGSSVWLKTDWHNTKYINVAIKAAPCCHSSSKDGATARFKQPWWRLRCQPYHPRGASAPPDAATRRDETCSASCCRARDAFRSCSKIRQAGCVGSSQCRGCACTTSR